MKSAFNLFASNLKKIILRTWLPSALASACAAACVVGLQIHNALAATLTAAAFGLLAYAAAAWTGCAVVSLLNGKSFRSNLPRAIKLALLLFAVGLALLLLAELAGTVPFFLKGSKGISESTVMLSGGITLATMLLFLLLSLPLWYSSWKYLIEPDGKLSHVVGCDYLQGLRHWGRLFVIALLTALIAGIISVVLLMPVAIAGQALALDNMGTAMGDASGLPTYFYALVFFTVLIVSFVSVYILTWVGITFYYGYGHIAAKIAARLQAKTGEVSPVSSQTYIDNNTL